MAWIAPKMNWLETEPINFADFNRIENNTGELAAYLTGIQYPIPTLTHITNRDKTSIDFLSSINRVEQNIEKIRNVFLTPPGYLGTKTWTVNKAFDYNDANRLETNVKLLMDYGPIVYKSFRYCGATNCGGSGLY